MMRRYNDTDVREDPTLIPEAEDYARKYTGSFEFMLAAQKRVQGGKSLTVPMARGVLNCMRMDPSADAPEPQPIPMPDQCPPSLSLEEPPKERRSSVRMRTRIRVPFGMSSANGTVLHRVDPRGYIEWGHPWERTGDPPRTGYAESRTLHVQWLGHRGGYPKNPILLDHRPDDVPYCRSGCFTGECPHCGWRTHLNPEAAPNDPLVCTKCSETFPQPHAKRQ